jgi:hypothetical protein
MNILNITSKGLGTHAVKSQLKQLKHIIRHLPLADTSLTIPEIAANVKISISTGTKLIKEFLEKNMCLRMANGNLKTVEGQSYTRSIRKIFM